MILIFFFPIQGICSPDPNGIPLEDSISLAPSVKVFRARMNLHRMRRATNLGLFIGTLVPLGVISAGVIPAIAAGTIGSASAFAYGAGFVGGITLGFSGTRKVFKSQGSIREIRKMKRIIQGAQAWLEDHSDSISEELLVSRTKNKHTQNTLARAKIISKFIGFHKKISDKISLFSGSEWDLTYYKTIFSNYAEYFEGLKRKKYDECLENEVIFLEKVPDFYLLFKLAEELSFAKDLDESMNRWESHSHHQTIKSQAKLLINYLRKPIFGIRTVIRNIEQFEELFEFVSQIRKRYPPPSKEVIANILVRPYTYFHAAHRQISPMRKDKDPHIQDLEYWVLLHYHFIVTMSHNLHYFPVSTQATKTHLKS